MSIQNVLANLSKSSIITKQKKFNAMLIPIKHTVGVERVIQMLKEVSGDTVRTLDPKTKQKMIQGKIP